MQLAPHLHRIGNDIVAAYLVEAPEGITVIDAGLPGHWRDLQAELTAMGDRSTTSEAWCSRTATATTSGSPSGCAGTTACRSTCTPPMQTARRAVTSRKSRWVRCASAPTTGFFAYALRKGGMRTRYLSEVIEVADGDVLALPGSPVVIGMPGHSPGSIAVHVPFVDAVFVGDALTTRHVLTGREGHAAGAVHRRAGGRARLARPARGRGCGVGAARPRCAVARQPRRCRGRRARRRATLG